MIPAEEGPTELPTHPSGGLGRRLLADSVIYGFGGVAGQAVAFLALPFYANLLGVAGFGTLALLTTTQSLAVMIVGLALPQAFFRAYVQRADTDAERAFALRSILAFRLATSIGGVALYSALAVLIMVVLFHDLAQLPLALLVAPIALLDTINLVPLSLLRAERRPAAYATLAFSRALLAPLASIVLLVVFHLGVLGVMLGTVASALVATGAGLGWMARTRRLAASWDMRFARDTLVFTLPLVPAAVAGWTLSLSDRYVIQLVAGSEAVGVYAAGYTFGLALSALLVQPFSLAWGSEYWSLAKRPDAKAIFARVLTAFSVTASLGALVVSVLAPDAVRLLLPASFTAARYVVPLASFAYVCYGIYSILGTGLNLESQTRWLPIAIGIPAIGNVGLNLVLVPVFGPIGAAASTFICYAALAALTWFFAERYYPVPWDLPRVVGAVLLGLALAEAATLGPDALAWRLACLALYPAVALALGLVRARDLAPMTALLRGRA